MHRPEAAYDLAIRGGRVMDPETDYDAVAPGFIDVDESRGLPALPVASVDAPHRDACNCFVSQALYTESQILGEPGT